jgi:hypothetical protein
LQRRFGRRFFERLKATDPAAAAISRRDQTVQPLAATRRDTKKGDNDMINRRSLMKNSGAAVAALGTGITAPLLNGFAATATLPFDNGERPLVKYPQKRLMIGQTPSPSRSGARSTNQ